MSKSSTEKPPVTEAELVDAYAEARKSLVAYRHTLLVNDEDAEIHPAPYHFRWSDSLLHGTQNEAIEGFRKGAKSQYVLRSFPLYCLTFPEVKYDYIVIIKNNDTQAKKTLKSIEKEYETNPAINQRKVKIREQSGNSFSVDTCNDAGEEVNIKIEAYGKGTSVRGLMEADRTPKIVIVDDPQDKDDSRSDTIMEADWEWFLSDIRFISHKCRIFLIGNNLGDKCIIERVFANADELKFKTSRIPVMVDGVPSWPGHDTKESIQIERDSYDRMGKLEIWLMEKMCVSTDEETRVFHERDFRYFNPAFSERIAADCRIGATLDPAASTEESACLRAIVVNAVDSDRNWFVLDVPYGRWNPTEMIDIIFDTVVKWKLKRFGIEKGMLEKVLTHFIYKEMAKRQIFFDIVPLEHAKEGSKLERIKMLAPRFKAHTIHFPDYAPWLSEIKSELAGVTKDGIKSLFIDLVDALAMQQQFEQAPFGKKQTSNLPRRGVTGARLI